MTFWKLLFWMTAIIQGLLYLNRLVCREDTSHTILNILLIGTSVVGLMIIYGYI